MRTIDTRGVKTGILADRTQELTAEGYEVVLVIQETAPPERVLKIIHACVGDDKIDLVIRHAELREYLQDALTGGVIGAGVGAGAIVVATLAGAPVSLPVTLTAIGIGALLGTTIGAAVTPICEARVYRYRGETRVRLIPT